MTESKGTHDMQEHGGVFDAERIEALVHTQRASAKILRERGEAMPGWHPSWADHMETVADALELIALLTAKPADGWKLVPVEPTEAMLNAVGGTDRFPSIKQHAITVYENMLAAAPQETSHEGK